MWKNKAIILLIVVVGLLSQIVSLYFFIFLLFLVYFICLYQSVGMCIWWNSYVGFRQFFFLK